MTVTTENSNFNQQSWQSLIGGYWDAIAPERLTDSQQVIKKMHQQGKFFLQMGHNFEKNFSSTDDWSELLDKTFAQIQTEFNPQQNQTQAQAQEHPKPNVENHHSEQFFDTFCHSQQQYWQKLIAELPSSFTDKTANTENPFKQAEDINQLFFASIIGYQQSLVAYNQFFLDFNQLSLSRMKLKITHLIATEKTISTMRDLYHLWTVCCEEIYAERVKTPEYSKLYGQLINSFVKLKQHWMAILDKQLAMMGIAGIGTVRKLQADLQQSHRQVKNLASEVSSLRQQLSAIQSSQQ